MYDRITDPGREVLRGASQEAHRLRHNFVRSEHLLVALLRHEANLAAAVLRECGAERTHVLATLDQRMVPLNERFIPLGDRHPLTPQVRAVLHWAFGEARSLGHNSVCTEHFLLGLLHEAEWITARVLAEFGLTLGRVRDAVAAIRVPVTAHVVGVDPDAV